MTRLLTEGPSDTSAERKSARVFSRSCWGLYWFPVTSQLRSLSPMPQIHVWKTPWLLTSELAHEAGACCVPGPRDPPPTGRRNAVKEVCRPDFRQLEKHHSSCSWKVSMNSTAALKRHGVGDNVFLFSFKKEVCLHKTLHS